MKIAGLRTLCMRSWEITWDETTDRVPWSSWRLRRRFKAFENSATSLRLARIVRMRISCWNRWICYSSTQRERLILCSWINCTPEPILWVSRPIGSPLQQTRMHTHMKSHLFTHWSSVSSYVRLRTWSVVVSSRARRTVSSYPVVRSPICTACISLVIVRIPK